MDWITQEIAIGNCDDARRFDKLREAGIGGILSLTGWPNGANNVHGVDWRCVELIDGFGNPVDQLREAVWQLHDLTERGRDRKSTRLNSSHSQQSRMPSSA